MSPMKEQEGLALIAEKEELQRAELEANLCRPSPKVYAKLMLIYFMENELCQAKFVWKRIPNDIKISDAELGKIWDIGKAMFDNNPSAIHEALGGNAWSNEISPYINQLRESIQNQYLDAVSCAYSSISLTDFSTYVGMPENEALALAERQNPVWSYDQGSKMINPQRKITFESTVVPSDEKLRKLTDYISFLEK